MTDNGLSVNCGQPSGRQAGVMETCWMSAEGAALAPDFATSEYEIKGQQSELEALSS
jgi:hypothetical protein